MERERLYKIAEEVHNVLNDGGVYADVYPHHTLPVIQVEISWGDWKHSHLRADWLISEHMKGLTKFSVQVTEEDGSDAYSAVHNYVAL